MKKNLIAIKIRYIFALVIGTVVLGAGGAFYITQSLSAHDTDDGFVTQSLSAQDTDVELEEFRSKLASYYTELLQVYPYIRDAAPPSLLGTLTEAQQAIPDLTYEDLALLREAISQNPTWWDFPKFVRSSLGPKTQGLYGPAEGLQDDQESLTSHSCTSLGILFPNNSISDWYLSRGLSLAAESVMELLPTDGLTILARTIPTGLWIAAKVLDLVLEAEYFANDECEQNNHRSIAHDVVGPNVDTTVSSRATQTSLDTHDTNIDGDLVTHDTNIDGDLVTHDANIDGDLVIHDGDIKQIIGGVQNTLDTVIEMKYVHLQLIDISATKKNGGRVFLLAASEAGVPVSVTCEVLQVAKANSPFAWMDVTGDTTCTVEKADGGIHKVVIDPVAANAQYFEIQVIHDDHGGDPAHRGIAVFDRRHVNNTNMGQ